MIYNFYVFNKKGKCIYYQEWHRQSVPENAEQEQQLIFGFLKALTTFVDRTSPTEFVLNTDPKCPNLQKDLRRIYGDLFVEYVTKNPMYKVGETVTCSHFLTAIDKFVKRHPNFKTE